MTTPWFTAFKGYGTKSPIDLRQNQLGQNRIQINAETYCLQDQDKRMLAMEAN